MPIRAALGALLVIFLIVIVFWMVFHQNGTTLTYCANDNTDWNVSGVIAHAINPFWVVTLTFPLVFFWKWLAGAKVWNPQRQPRWADLRKEPEKLKREAKNDR